MARTRWKTWLRLAVSAALIALLLTQVDLAAVFGILSGLSLAWFAIALGVGFVATMAAGLGWKVLLDAQGLRLPIRDVLIMHIVGLFFAAFTPGGLGGDVLRTVRVRQSTQRTVEGGAAVVASRVLSILALFTAAALASIARPDSQVRTISLIAGLASITAMGLILALEVPLSMILARLPRAGWADVGRAGVKSLYAFRRAPGQLLAAFACLAIYQVLSAVVIAALARAMSIHLGLLDAIALGLMARLTAFLPISISGIGVQEGAFVVLFGLVGLTPSQALAVSLMDHVVLTVIPLIGGALYALGADVRWTSRPAIVPDAPPADRQTGATRQRP